MSCSTSTYLGDAMLPRSTTPQSGPISSAMARALSSSGLRYVGLAVAMSTRAKARSAPRVTGVSTERRPALGVITNDPAPEIGEAGIGRPRERARVGQLAAEIEAAQKGEHVADGRAVGRAQSRREVERRALRHDHRRAPPAAVGRGQQKDLMCRFRGVQGSGSRLNLSSTSPASGPTRSAPSSEYCSIFATTSGLAAATLCCSLGSSGRS